MALDSTIAEVQQTAGLVRIWLEWDWEGGEAAFRKAIQINPNYAGARMAYAAFLALMRRQDEARAQIERVLALDPLNTMVRMFNGFLLFMERRYAESIEAYEALHLLEPDNPLGYKNLAGLYYLTGNYDDALEMVRKSFPGDQELDGALDRGYAEGGFRRAIVRYAEILAARPGAAEQQSLNIAYYYAWAGEKERTLEWLEVAYQARVTNMLSINTAPDIDLVRDDPRFRALLRRMNLPH